MTAAAEVIRQHQRVDRGCACGWGAWGASHAEHVAEALSEAGLLAPPPPRAQGGIVHEAVAVMDRWREAWQTATRATDGDRILDPGEAYIPLTPEKRARAVEVLRRIYPPSLPLPAPTWETAGDLGRLSVEAAEQQGAETEAAEQRARAERAEEELVRVTAERDQWPAEAHERIADLEADLERERDYGRRLQAAWKLAETERDVFAQGLADVREGRERMRGRRDRWRKRAETAQADAATYYTDAVALRAAVDTARARLHTIRRDTRHPAVRAAVAHVLTALEPTETR